MTCKRANSVGPFRQVRPCPDRWQTGDEPDGWLGLLAPLLPLLAPTKTPTMPRPPPTHFPTWSRDSLDKRGEIQGTYLAPSNLHSRHFGGWNAQNWRQSNLLNCFHEFSQADCRHHDAKCIFRFFVCERHGCKMREASPQCLSDLSMLPCNKPFHACLPKVTNLSKKNHPSPGTFPTPPTSRALNILKTQEFLGIVWCLLPPCYGANFQLNLAILVNLIKLVNQEILMNFVTLMKLVM